MLPFLRMRPAQPLAASERTSSLARVAVRHTSLALGLIAATVGCAGPTGEMDAPGSPAELETLGQAVSCDPQMFRFPVDAAHNIGYDAASCGTGTCVTSCPDQHANSDYGGAHHGNDVFAFYRAPLVAVVNGTVMRAGVASSTSGIRVTIADGCGWWYYYGHMDQMVVSVGQHVSAGQVIGYMGNSGAPSVHLHFNVSRDGDYNNDIDPFALLKATSPTACGTTPENCTAGEAQGCGAFGCFCVNHACNGGYCPGPGCSAQTIANCGAFGSGCVDGKCNGGTSPGTGCTAKETADCATTGANCADHKCSGGTALGTGCTWLETHNCGAYGAGCVDHQCNGGAGPGTGCTTRETSDCAKTGAKCADHQCSGGTAPGTGCTWLETHNCEANGATCVDHKCSGGTAPGSGCTAYETTACTGKGCGCADHTCGGGSCPGTGCTAKQTADCVRVGATCTRGTCRVDGGSIAVDGGEPYEPPNDGGSNYTPEGDGGIVELEDGGRSTPMGDDGGSPDEGLQPNGMITGGCAATPGAALWALCFVVGAFRRRVA